MRRHKIRRDAATDVHHVTGFGACVRANGCSAHDLEVLDDALLLVTEVVTNSIKYGGPPSLLAIDCDERTLHVRIRDGGTALPEVRSASDQDQSRRGFTLVRLLSDAWGVEPVRDECGLGKAVRFRLCVSPSRGAHGPSEQRVAPAGGRLRPLVDVDEHS